MMITALTFTAILFSFDVLQVLAQSYYSGQHHQYGGYGAQRQRPQKVYATSKESFSITKGGFNPRVYGGAKLTPRKKFTPKKAVKKDTCPATNNCRCKKTTFKVARARLSFYDHFAFALEDKCWLASVSDERELQKLIDFAIKEGQYIQTAPGMPENATDPMLAQIYIGAARLSVVNDAVATDGSPHGPWKWIDGCTPYTFNIFSNGQPNNQPTGNATFQDVAAIAFMDDGTLMMGDVNDINRDAMLPAIYECCSKKKKNSGYY